MSRDHPPVAYIYGHQQWYRQLRQKLSDREDVLQAIKRD